MDGRRGLDGGRGVDERSGNRWRERVDGGKGEGIQKKKTWCLFSDQKLNIRNQAIHKVGKKKILTLLGSHSACNSDTGNHSSSVNVI